MTNKYITLNKKIELVNAITEFSVDNLMLNPIFREVATVCYISKYYSDYEFKTDDNDETDLILTYDMLITSGVYYDEILKSIEPKELESIYRMIEDSINSKISLLNVILTKMDKFSTEDMIEKLNSFDLTKYTQIQDVVKTLQGK